MIAVEKYWILLIPFALAIIILAILRIDYLLALVAFLTPLSTTLGELGIYSPIGVEMSLPTEPLLFGLMIIAWIKMFSDSNLFRGLTSICEAGMKVGKPSQVAIKPPLTLPVI